MTLACGHGRLLMPSGMLQNSPWHEAQFAPPLPQAEVDVPLLQTWPLRQPVLQQVIAVPMVPQRPAPPSVPTHEDVAMRVSHALLSCAASQYWQSLEGLRPPVK